MRCGCQTGTVSDGMRCVFIRPSKSELCSSQPGYGHFQAYGYNGTSLIVVQGSIFPASRLKILTPKK